MRMIVGVSMVVRRIMVMMLVGVSVSVDVLTGMNMRMSMIIMMVMIVMVGMRATGAVQSLIEHPAADGHDGKSGDSA